MPVSSRIFYALVALGAVLALGWGLSAAGAEGFVFGLFSFLIVGGALVCVWERSVVRSAFCLLATFGGTAGLFLMLGSDFLAMSQILIYVGGILALILFGVMLTPPDLTERKLPRVVGGVVAIGAAFAWIAAKVSLSVKWVQTPELPPPREQTREIGVGFLDAQAYVIPFELAAIVLTVALVAAVYIARRRRADLVEEGAAR